MVRPVHLTGVSLLPGRLEFGCHKRKKGHEQNIKAFQLSSGDLKTRKLREICQPEVQFSLFFYRRTNAHLCAICLPSL